MEENLFSSGIPDYKGQFVHETQVESNSCNEFPKGSDPLDSLKQNLGQVLNVSQIADYTRLDSKTIRKYYRQLGGIRVGSRILFFEKEFIDAVQARREVVCPSSERGYEAGESVHDQEGGSGLGSGNAAKTRKRMVKEDRHGLLD